MKVESSFRRCARRAGGLHLGLTIHFPVAIATLVPGGDVDRYQQVTVTFGFVAWRWTLHFLYDRH